MKCVVTGGCGFIGSHLVERLVQTGHAVAVVDDLSTGDISFLNSEVSLLEGSVTDLELLISVTGERTGSFTPRRWPASSGRWEDPVGTHHVNVTGTLNVLQAARINGVSKVVISSSSSVYGDQGQCHVMREDLQPNPLSPYAVQKLVGEQYAAMYARLFGLQVSSLRYFNVYGPGQPTTGLTC